MNGAALLGRALAGGREWGKGMGGEIFALRRPRPYSRTLRGYHCDPNAAHCRHHEHTMPHIETCSFYNDAAREGRALGGGQATFGLPLQHLPYRERDGQSDN